MEKDKLEDAITELTGLLATDRETEDKFQTYFENHPIVFELMGYQQSYPKPRFPLSDGEYLVPDFLAKRFDNLYDIIDLKTPQEKLIKLKRHRDHLYAKIDEYIAQVETYSEYFDDNKNRQAVETQYGFDVQKSPDMVIVAGLDSDVDKKLLHKLVRRRTGALKIVTYDDVLSALAFHHAKLFGHTENLPGASWHAIVTLCYLGEHRRKYVFDCGDTLKQNRWSVYLDEHNNLTFELVDSLGNSHILSTHSFEMGKSAYIACEFGSSDSFSLMQILINNRIVAKLETAAPTLISSGFDFKRQTIGADIEGHNNGRFDMAELIVYNRVLSFRERAGLAEHMFNEIFAK